VQQPAAKLLPVLAKTLQLTEGGRDLASMPGPD